MHTAEQRAIAQAAQVLQGVAESHSALTMRQSAAKLADNPPRYLPCFGITSVMNVSNDSCNNNFSERLFEACRADTRIAADVLLLPPSSYHVTLRGLERLLPPPAVAMTDGICARFCGDLAERLIDCDQAVLDAARAHIAPETRRINFKVMCAEPMNGALVLLVDAADEPSRQALHGAQQVLADRMASDHTQVYHLSVGYFLPSRVQHDGQPLMKAAATHLDTMVESLLGPERIVSVELPRVCHYASMEQFEPLFPMDVRGAAAPA